MTINFNVTPSQKKMIDSRTTENGFDDISAYLKVVALKTQPFIVSDAGFTSEEATIALEFDVTDEQHKRIHENVKETGCEDLTMYLQYVSMHGAVSSIIEVRSTGNLDAMLQRIAASRNK